MNVFIIGGDGFIGAHICKKFVDHGHSVTVFGPRLNEGLLEDVENEIARTDGDIQNPHQLFEGLLASKAEIIVHLAAFGAGKDGLTKSANDFPKKALDVNVIGFYNVLEAAKLLGIPRLIWSSSSVVYGFSGCYPEGCVNEQAVVNPATFYGSTKVMNELTARYYRNQFQMEITGLRLPLIIGSGKWYKGAAAAITGIFEQSSPNGETVVKGGRERFDLMYVNDVADVFYQAAVTNKPLSDIYNVTGCTTSLQQIADSVMRLVPGYRVALELETSAATYPLMDTSKIERELGFTPRYSGYEACQDYLWELGRM